MYDNPGCSNKNRTRLQKPMIEENYEINEKQHGFPKNRSTIYVIYIIRQFAEKAIQLINHSTLHRYEQSIRLSQVKRCARYIKTRYLRKSKN